MKNETSVAAVCLFVVVLSGCRTVGPGAATGGAFGTFAGGLTESYILDVKVGVV